MPKGQKKTPRSFKVLIADSWTLEIAALVLGIVSLVAIIILLSVYDGEPQFSFGIVNLNTVIAILATTYRIGFMVPASEALAQWKWLWFSGKARPLGDFDSIDDASRGTRGSLLHLWETKGWSVTAIGAWVTILSLATEPFIQQMVTFRDTTFFEPSARVQIPFAQRWAGGREVANSPDDMFSRNLDGETPQTVISGYGTARDIQLNQSAQAAVQFGLISNAAAVAAQLPLSCPSGNCTWPTYLSLAVCSRCTDLSDRIESFPRTDYPMGWFRPGRSTGPAGDGPQTLTEYVLPNGLSINNRRTGQSYGYRAEPVVATTFVDLRPSTSLTLQDISTLLFSTTILRVPDSHYPVDGIWPENVEIEAAECGLYLCIKEFDSRVEDGVLTEATKEVASTRDPDSFRIDVSRGCGGECGELVFQGVETDVDALFANETYFPRTDLSIRVPPGTISSNNLERGDVSQGSVDALSSYIRSLFDEGTFNNASINVSNEDTPCFANGLVVPCGDLRNLSGMATGPTGNPGAVETATDFSPVVMSAIWGTPNLTATFANLASSLTNEIRQHGADSQIDIVGELGVVHTVLRVRWAWIALPAFLLAASILFFVLTIIESIRTTTPLWKGSALAVLYHGVEGKVRATLEHWDLPSQMSDAAEEVKVRLRREATDDALLLRTGPDKAQTFPLMSMRGTDRPSTPSHDVENEEHGSQDHLSHVQTAPHIHGNIP